MSRTLFEIVPSASGGWSIRRDGRIFDEDLTRNVAIMRTRSYASFIGTKRGQTVEVVMKNNHGGIIGREFYLSEHDNDRKS